MLKTSFLLITLALNASSAFANTATTAKTNCEDEKNYPVIEKTELQSLVDQKSVFVVDVNSKASFEKTHVPTAINYGMEKAHFVKKLPADKNALIVSYCGGPACTAWKKAAVEACKSGYTNIKHFKGGISGWNSKT